MALAQDFPITHMEPFDEDLWVNKAKANSHNLKSLRQSVFIAERNYRRQSSAALPKVDFVASIAEQDQQGRPFVINGRTESIGIQVSVPLFAGMGDFYAAREFKMRYLQTSEDAEAQTRELIQVVRNRFRSIYTDVLTVEAQRRALASSERALKAVQAEYNAGTRNLTDVLNTQQQYFTARKALSHARYDYVLDKLQLKLFAGELSIDDLKEINQWLVIDDTLMDLNTIP
jgi:outer membrane protein